MRELVIARIMEAIEEDGYDLAELEMNDPVEVEELPDLDDLTLLEIYTEMFSFHG